ncbi:MAG: PocR ligand-binding domain-containing protein [Clostridia bacterium]|nr:PocR ligand-binding domain-containing protein [Clostridia bacterium]
MKQPEIQALLIELHNATGFRISIHDRDFKEYFSYPESPLEFCKIIHKSNEAKSCCHESDRRAFENADVARGLVVYKCPFGLYEAVCPLYRYGMPVGYLMMGQVAENKKFDFDASACEHLECSEELLSAFEKIPKVSGERMRTYANIMSVFAGYITLSNIINLKTRDLPESVYKYLSEHFKEKITLEMLCGKFLCSRTHLIKSFSKKYGSSINEVINKMRLEYADRLISEGKMAMKNISSESGFSDAGYFSKTYKKHFGYSPTEAKNREKTDA